jgi:hypothetical protein
MPTFDYQIDGERVPGTTTIISRWKDSGALIFWAWRQGKDGKDFRETKNAAADAGTCVHDMVECTIRKKKFDRKKYQPEVLTRAQGAFDAFKEWKRQTRLKVAETELPLVSRKYRYGGCLDAMLVQGKLALGDWKSSNGVYLDYLLQLAAYAILWEENFPDRPIEGGFHLLRFSKQNQPDDPISFAHHFWSDLELAKKQFVLLREAYDNDQRLKKLV